jgi:uncharacterized protein (DUF58 family)
MRREVTPAGRLVFYSMCAAAALTIDVRHLMAYHTFSVLFVMISFSILHSFIFGGRFTVRRALPPYVTAGKEFTYSITVQCDSRKTRGDITLMESLEDPRPTWREFRDFKEFPIIKTKRGRSGSGAGSGGSGAKQKSRGRWRRLVDKKTVVPGLIMSKPQDLQPGLAAEFRMTVTPLKRGKIVFKGVSVTAPDPLGLIRCSRNVPRPESLVVLPARYRLPGIVLSGSRRHHPGGVTLASSVGESEEFYCLRDYAPGDSIRSIDWKSWAKTGKPVTRTFQEEYFSHHALVVDTFADASFAEAFEVCVSTAASLLMSVDTLESLLDLIFVNNEVFNCLTTGRNVSDKAAAMEMLAALDLSPGDESFSVLSASIKNRVPILNSLICVFLKWDEERRALVRFVKALGVPVTVLLVTDAVNAPGAQKGFAGTDFAGRGLAGTGNESPALEGGVCVIDPKNPEAALMGLAGRL